MCNTDHFLESYIIGNIYGHMNVVSISKDLMKHEYHYIIATCGLCKFGGLLQLVG